MAKMFFGRTKQAKLVSEQGWHSGDASPGSSSGLTLLPEVSGVKPGFYLYSALKSTKKCNLKTMTINDFTRRNAGTGTLSKSYV